MLYLISCIGHLLGGIDTVIVNDLMYTYNTKGHVLTSGGDYYQVYTTLLSE
jgi:hypothetical protein